MLLNPSIIALIMVSFTISIMLIITTIFAIHLLMYWDISSGSELQLKLERRTYLISTLLAWAVASELLSLILFVYNAESMSGQFVGAMCATGVLNVNAWGWPTLILKIAIFFVGFVWIALNRIDNKGFDYPLIKIKYYLLLILTPMVIAETVMLTRYFSEMNPNIITSCCGSLFSSSAEGVSAQLSGYSPVTAMGLLYGSGLLVMSTGTWFLIKKRDGYLFAISSVIAFTAAIVSIISYLSSYIYEHPNHHCPFCILKSGHDYAGYTLYIPLFIATALALSAGIISVFQHTPSIAAAVDRESSRLTLTALSIFTIFYLISVFSVASSNLTMGAVWW